MCSNKFEWLLIRVEEKIFLQLVLSFEAHAARLQEAVHQTDPREDDGRETKQPAESEEVSVRIQERVCYFNHF